MKRYIISLMVIVLIVAMVVIPWTPIAKGANGTPFPTCLDFCEEQAICQCAKILGGSLRLTVCNIGANCGEGCECEVDALCKPWEKDIVVQSFPPEPPFADNCQPW